MIPYGRQSVSQADIDAVDEVLRGDWLTTGPYVREFERQVAHLSGSESAVAVSSGTAALHAAYAAMDLQPDDEVITAPMTFMATQSAAIFAGAQVRFADVLPGSGLIDPAQVHAAITDRTKVIAAVDYAGQPADMDALRALADANGAFLLEDAAHSVGASYRGRPVGSLADLTTFSFFPTKNLTTGEGGAVVGDPELVARARSFANHGLVRDPDEQDWPLEGPWHQEIHRLGLNYRMPDINAALGLSQLTRLAQFGRRRQSVVERYREAFQGVDGLDVIDVVPDAQPFWHLFPLLVPANLRKQIFVGLREAGVGVQVNYLPVHLHPYFRALGYDWGDFPHAEQFYRREISLPLHAELTDDEVAHVIASVLDLVATAR